MAYPTFKPIVDEVTKMMGRVSGSAVQQYTEPEIKMAVNQIFDYLWNKRHWEHLWEWRTATIGAGGILTSDLENIRMYSDVTVIRDADTHRTIPFPFETEHLYITGSKPLYVTVLPWHHAQAETRFFRFWPDGATGPVELYSGYRPGAFAADDDVVPMDWNLMTFGAAWYMLADDGLNPASADKYQGLFDLTYQGIVSRLNSGAIGHGSGRRHGQTVLIQP